MITRNNVSEIHKSLLDTPVLFIAGARQTGKTTLVRQIAKETGAEYFSLDDLGMLTAARNNPQGFVDGLPPRVIIDEVQRVPDLLVAIKNIVDKDRTPGRFLLTGSANVLTLPKLAESLAGRMEIHMLRPFSQGEFIGRKETFIDDVFGDTFKGGKGENGSSANIIDTIIAGGFPEANQRTSPGRRTAWFRNYLTTIIQRDIKELAHIDGLTQIPDLLKMIAVRCANMLNLADISRSLQISQTSLKRYTAMLESIFLTYRLQPWHVNMNSRLSKSPKVYLEDTGLACHLLGIDSVRLVNDRSMLGSLLECFAVNELRKQIEWSTTRPGIYHFRTHEGREVDCILENAAGYCVGIEIKAATRVTADDAKGLVFLKENIQKKFLRGIVLYNGDAVIPFEQNIHAMPLSAIWS